MESDAKKKILARRAKFVAAALAGVACGKEPFSNPQPCLSVMPTNADAGAGTPPDVDDAGTTASTDPPDAAVAPIAPTVCLRIAMPRDAGYVAPAPCLSPMPPAPKPTPCLSK